MEDTRRERELLPLAAPENEERIGVHHEHRSVELRLLARAVVGSVEGVVHAVERSDACHDELTLPDQGAQIAPWAEASSADGAAT